MNRYLGYILVIMLLLLLGTYSCELEKVDACTCIESVSPNVARAGEIITLGGDYTNFDKSNDKLRIGNITVPSENVDMVTGNLEVRIPSGISSPEVSVVLDKVLCNSSIPEACKNSFNYKMPTVDNISPDKAKHSTMVTISGTNFRGGDESEENKVFFEGVTEPAIITEATETNLKVLVPKGANSGPITVEVDGFPASNTPDFTYVFTATVSLLAGTFSEFGGAMNGSGSDAKFDAPTGIDVYPSSTVVTSIYVADTGNNVIRHISPEGLATTVAGDFNELPGHIDHPNDLAKSRFHTPEDIAVDLDGENIFVTESFNHTVRKILIADGRVTTIAGMPHPALPDFMDGSSSIARFHSPHGITVVNNDLIYISDKTNQRIRIIDTKMNQVSTLAGNGSLDLVDGFNSPRGLTYDSNNSVVYVADLLFSRIRSITTSSGNVETIVGMEEFNQPGDVAIDMEGNIYVADTGNHRIKRIDRNTKEVTNVAGTGVAGPMNNPGNQEQDGEIAQFNLPSGIAYDCQNNIIYVTDTGNNIVRKIKLE